MDKVRFGIGPHVFQGFHDGKHGMAGAIVFVTADTLRQVADVMQSEHTTDFDRLHNAPEEDWATLAFGAEPDQYKVAPDGVTPLYELVAAEPSIVQRWNPNGGTTHERHFGEGNVEIVPNGVWENEETLDGFFVRQDEWTPVCHGFVIDAEGWANGRGDAPPIDTERAVAARREAEEAEPRRFVVDVRVPVAISVYADDEDMANSMALDALLSQGVIQRFHEMVDTDDSDFVPSDSEPYAEAGLAD